MCKDRSCELIIKVGPIPSQIRGDCKRRDCDQTGQIVTLDDPGDWYNDGESCTADYCEGSEPKHALLQDGVQCPEIGAGVCFNGSCVECISGVAERCGISFACEGTECVKEMCTQKKNNMVDPGLETGIDCGGYCVACPTGQSCNEGPNCLDRVCLNGVCAPPTHTDGVKNGDETGIDCGCPTCDLCPEGFDCVSGEDCESHVCWAAKCEAPKCIDGFQNGDEVGVDCGGPCSACL